MGKSRKFTVTAVVIGIVSLATALVAAGAFAASKVLTQDAGKAVIEDAAEQLGVEPTALSDALKQALKNRIDEAVESGRLTQERAAQLKERIDASETPFLFGGKRGLGLRGKGAKLEAAAAYLGVTQAQLSEALRSGKTMADVATEHGKSVDGLVATLTEEAKKRIAEAVEAGKLTQAEADAKLERLGEHVTALVNGEGKKRFGRPSGFQPPVFNG